MSSLRMRGSVALSAALLAGCSPGLTAAVHTGAAPLRLALYYGYPSLVNGASGDLERSAAVFAAYDIVVLGDGLEFDTDSAGYAGRAEHVFTVRLIERLRRSSRKTAVFGYVDLGNTQRLPLVDLVDRIERWASMGAAGVLLDEAGFDFGVTRERQNAAIDAAHAAGLRVCMNAFRPADVFGDRPTPINAVGGGNPRGLPTSLTAADAVLLESFAVAAAGFEAVETLTARVSVALDGRRRFGTSVFGVATGVPSMHANANYGWWMAAVLGLDGFAWSDAAYGAPTSRLAEVQRPAAEVGLREARPLSEPDLRRTVWRRRTTAGAITVDLGTRTGALEP